MMKALAIAIFALIGLSEKAFSDVVYIQVPESVRKSYEDKKKFALAIQTKTRAGKDGSIEVFIRSCGYIRVPRNSQNEIPKPGVLISANVTRCQVIDWK